MNRRVLAVLGSGHLCVDLCQGAVPALLPFLAAEHGYSYAALGALLLFSAIGPVAADCASRQRRDGESEGAVMEQRRSPRARVEMECTLRRRTGSPISARTVDVGPGGMCVATSRPLSLDEVLSFDLAPRINGRARVLRQQGHDTYAVRFELLAEPALAELNALAVATR